MPLIPTEESDQYKLELSRIKSIIRRYYIDRMRERKVNLLMVYRQIMRMRLSDPLPNWDKVVVVIAPIYDYWFSKRAGFGADVDKVAREIMSAIQYEELAERQDKL